MKQTDKYKALAALVRAFFEGFMSGVLDAYDVERREKSNPKTVKQAMLNHYESIAPAFHDLLFYPIATMNFDLKTITERVQQLRGSNPTPEQLLQTACADEAMHQAVVAEYRRNFSHLLNGRLATEQEHFDNYTRNGGEPATVDTQMALHEVAKTAMRAYFRGLKCGENGYSRFQQVSTILLLINSANSLINDTPIGNIASQAQHINEVYLKACGSAKNVDTVNKASSEAIKEFVQQYKEEIDKPKG